MSCDYCNKDAMMNNTMDANYCPKCGRNLKEKDNGFEYSIKIPVPIGTKVWTFWTDCCHACYFQEKENRPIDVHCDRRAACHTLKHSIQNKILTFSNLETVLDGWGEFYFKTAAEAEAAGNKRVEENIKKMRSLGYDIDNRGYATKKEGWDTRDE